MPTAADATSTARLLDLAVRRPVPACCC